MPPAEAGSEFKNSQLTQRFRAGLFSFTLAGFNPTDESRASGQIPEECRRLKPALVYWGELPSTPRQKRALRAGLSCRRPAGRDSILHPHADGRDT